MDPIGSVKLATRDKAEGKQHNNRNTIKLYARPKTEISTARALFMHFLPECNARRLRRLPLARRHMTVARQPPKRFPENPLA